MNITEDATESRSLLVCFPGGKHYCLSRNDFLGLVETLCRAECSYWLDWKSPEHVSIRARLLGGKGGFGSNLRAQGSKMSAKRRHIGNDDYRDLTTGQSLRTINENRMIEDYLRREPELRRRAEEERRERLERAQAVARRNPMSVDVDFIQKSREISDIVEAAVRATFADSDDSNDDVGEQEEEEDSPSSSNNYNQDSTLKPDLDERDKGKGFIKHPTS